MTVIVFATKILADTILREIAATPWGSVWVWYDPDQTTNTVQYNQGADGRCAIAHPFNEMDADWLEAYMDGWLVAGTVQIRDALPEDWQVLPEREG